MFRILIVEDEPDIGELLQTYLEHAGMCPVWPRRDRVR